MLVFGMAAIITLDTVLPFIFYAPFHGPSLIFMVLYLWSKHNPAAQVGFFGVIKFQALYLPFALLGLDVIQGASPISGVLGILAGHMYYFLTEVYPRTSGRNVIQTPTWLCVIIMPIVIFYAFCHSTVGQYIFDHLFLFTFSRPSIYIPCRARLVYRYRLGSVPVQQVNAVHPSDSGFRAFSGQARRLAD